MFSLRQVEVRFADARAPVLTVEQWDVGAGEHWALVGPSGSGKSTLLHLLAGLLRPTRGQVRVAGQDLAALGGADLDHWRGRTIGLVPQRLHLLRSLSVLDNVVLASYLAGGGTDRTRPRVLLETLGLGSRIHAKPAQLSQGEAQRVAIARAVVNRPAVLLADEPTANLDDEHCESALSTLVGQARAVGATLVVATHDHRVRGVFEHVRSVPERGSAAGDVAERTGAADAAERTGEPVRAERGGPSSGVGAAA